MSEELYILGTNQHSYKQGDTVSETIETGEPKVGDCVYFLSVKRPIGLIAKAEATKLLENGLVQFLIIDCRDENELIPEFVLQNQFTNMQWPTAGSYQLFEPIIQHSSLASLWKSSSGQHVVSQIINLFTCNKSPDSWYQKYVDFVDWFKTTKSHFTDDDIIKLWAGSDAISSIAPKQINHDQCVRNMPHLRSIVEKIIQSPTKETHKEVKVQWKTDTDFKDIFHVAINRIFAANEPQRFTSIVSESNYFKPLYRELAPLLGITVKYSNWVDCNILLKKAITPLLDLDNIEVNTLLWDLAEYLKEGGSSKIEFLDNKDKATGVGVGESDSDDRECNMSVSLNQILYGPPGTGKTYYTIEAAVQAADPEFYFSLNIDPKIGSAGEKRTKLTEKYKELTGAKRIRFVTFHQSYGYEEFVEGLSATTTDSGQVKYAIKDGIFKTIADAARKNLEDSQKEQEEFNQEQKFDLALEAFKLSIFEASDAFSLTDAVSIVAIEEEGFRYSGDWKSSQIMKFEDLKLLYLAGAKSRQNIKQSDFVSGLARQHASYFFKVLKQIQNHIPKELPASEKCVKQNFVLVIDEINRGNISKIFGELITLIEPSKRMPADKSTDDEYLEISLAHSKPLFSVPDNLYLIGTMNTADRSLAMMDTALRRRFDFVEMMPKADLFSDHSIEWQEQQINLQSLLESLNRRIEVLYEREHTLGHAFLFPAYNAAKDGEHELAFTELKNAFKNKIIPLLEEYFYEDWNKIRLVLGDSWKNDESLRFLEKQEDLYSELFGGEHGLELYEEKKTTYKIKPFDCGGTVWDDAQAYIGIYTKGSNERSF